MGELLIAVAAAPRVQRDTHAMMKEEEQKKAEENLVLQQGKKKQKQDEEAKQQLQVDLLHLYHSILALNGATILRDEEFLQFVVDITTIASQLPATVVPRPEQFVLMFVLLSGLNAFSTTLL